MTKFFTAGLLISLFLITGGANAKDLKVIVSIKPLHSLVTAVMGDRGEVELLLDSALTPHVFRMRPSHIRKVIDADVLFYISPKLETFLNKSLRRPGGSLKIVALAEDKEIKLHPYRTSKIWFSEKKEGDEHKDHSYDNMDPHIWLDPANSRRMAVIIEETLSELDPANRLTYIRNSKILIKRLYAQEDRLRDALRPFREKPMIVYHDAFQYFEKAFLLYSIGAIQLRADQPPSIKHLKSLKKAAAENNVTCVLGVPGAHPKIANTVMFSTDASYNIVDPLGLYLKAGTELYFELMEEITHNIVECQGDMKADELFPMLRAVPPPLKPSPKDKPTLPLQLSPAADE